MPLGLVILCLHEWVVVAEMVSIVTNPSSAARHHVCAASKDEPVDVEVIDGLKARFVIPGNSCDETHRGRRSTATNAATTTVAAAAAAATGAATGKTGFKNVAPEARRAGHEHLARAVRGLLVEGGEIAVREPKGRLRVNPLQETPCPGGGDEVRGRARKNLRFAHVLVYDRGDVRGALDGLVLEVPRDDVRKTGGVVEPHVEELRVRGHVRKQRLQVRRERRHRRDVVLEHQGGAVPARRRDLAQDAEVAELVPQRGVPLLRRELAYAARSVRRPIRTRLRDFFHECALARRDSKRVQRVSVDGREAPDAVRRHVHPRHLRFHVPPPVRSPVQVDVHHVRQGVVPPEVAVEEGAVLGVR